MNHLPQHIAFIMDGNGRWAKEHGLNRVFGHREGLKTAENVIGQTLKFGIRCISLYVFSTENWKRPKAEIDGLFRLADNYLSRFENFCKDRIRVVVSGERHGLPEKLIAKIADIERKTADFDSLCVNLCINYGGRKEIVSAVSALLAEGLEVTENALLKKMYRDLPEPDLIVRTGGQMRMSNFLLYQSAYSELFFTDTLWPDFGETEYNAILETYSKRTRNFGGIGGNNA